MNVFNLAFSSTIAVVSSAEGLLLTSIVEDIATVAAVEHSATEVALSRSRILDMVVQILPEWDSSVEREVTRFPFEVFMNRSQFLKFLLPLKIIIGKLFMSC